LRRPIEGRLSRHAPLPSLSPIRAASITTGTARYSCPRKKLGRGKCVQGTLQGVRLCVFCVVLPSVCFF